MAILGGGRELQGPLGSQDEDRTIEVRSNHRAFRHGIIVLYIEDRLDGHCVQLVPVSHTTRRMELTFSAALTQQRYAISRLFT